MSSFRPYRFAAWLVALALTGVMVSACGYRPLYGQTSAQTNGHTVADLAAIEIKPIPNREGQMMRNALKRRLVVRPGAPVRYALNVQLNENISVLAVDSGSFATRANLIMSASYSLEDVSDHKPLAHGSARSVASYNILTSDFATYAARQDARAKAIESLADDIRTRLAIYFDAGPQPASPQSTGTLQP